MDFKYLAIGLCVALGVFLLVTELRRKQKARLIWRLAASAIAVISFYLMLYPPSYQTKKQTGVQEVNLITATDAIHTDINNSGGVSYSLDYQYFTKNKKSGVRFVPDLEYFLKSKPGLQVIHIYGNGLNSEQLQLLKGKQLSFHSAAMPEGLITLNWNAQLKATEQLVLQGRYEQAGQNPVKLVLQGLGTKLDSVSINQKGPQSFILKAVPQQAGKAVFRLIGIRGRDTLFSEPVPVEMKESVPVRVLMLASNPDFEYKFLKNWFFEKQYPLIFRSRISKDKYSTDFLNTKVNVLNVISAELLKKMDLLILDEEELAQLSGAELSNIRHAVADGLGIFIQVSSLKESARIGVGRYESQDLQHKPLIGTLALQGTTLSALPVEQLLFLKPMANDLPLFQERSGKILVSTSISGTGRQTVSVLPATYQWMLNGAAADYAQFWSAVVNKTARASAAKQTWSLSPAMPVKGEQINISISLSQGGPVPPFKVGGVLMSPLQNRELATQWQLNTWAAEPGWNTLSFGEVNDAFYVYNKSDYQQLHDARNWLATTQFVKDHPVSDKIRKASVLLEKQLSVWWFFLLFLISTSFLWYETKML